MQASERSQSLSQFREQAVATIERLNQTGKRKSSPSTVKPALGLSPVIYDELAREAELSRDAATIRRSRQEFKDGKSQDVQAFFSELRADRLS